MTTREKILAAVLQNQPQKSPLPDISKFKGQKGDYVQTYVDIFDSIGGKAFLVEDMNEVKALIREHFDVTQRMVTTLPELGDTAELLSLTVDPHTLQDVELAVIQANLAVAENGAVWLTEQVMGHRILPYICQHLAVVVAAGSIVPTLHEAYAQIGEGNYGFAGFIGGPSKTADIEQALVLGAHGPITMIVFVVKSQIELTND
jgi:L-lactate dehydrogenase complex protein LldG